jgi:large subunit ribosomal protein L33
MRDVILLACEDCKQRNYSATKDKKKQTGKISVKKYCKFCNKHTVHKETKA